jgi:uncharacterized phage protein (TIGR02220 family)
MEMASGRKNYFRHSFFARNDMKLKLLRDRVGIGFYFYYFSLLEQCGEASSDVLQETYEFHNSTIRNLWSINLKKSERVAIEMMSVGLLEFKKLENSFQFTIPNFAKYMGKYESKLDSNSPNKRKEKEIKEKKSIMSPSAPVVADEKKSNPELFAVEAPAVEEEISLTDLERNALTALNSICGKSFRPTKGNMKFIKARIKEGYKFEDFVKVINFKLDQWGNDTKMRTYLRPETIFGTKFDSYLAEASDERLKEISDDQIIRDALGWVV